MNKHIMLDLETLGVGPNACIVAIGAVGFTIPHTNYIKFYTAVSPNNGIIDGETVMWWLTQNDAARAALQDGIPPLEALKRFDAWVKEFGAPSEVRMWGNGTDFDNVILRSAFTNYGLVAPWTGRNNRCFRTVKAIAKAMGMVKPERTGTHHNALDDAVYQADALLEFARWVPID
jgi:exodeoxyribonuclease VIII